MAAKDSPQAATENTMAAVQKVFDEAEAKGYFGETVDDTPRNNYSVGGVTSGAPVPDERRK